MAILGGAGNPVGGSFTGPAEALEVIGNHCYAYSGQVGITDATTNLLSFTSGNYYSRVKVQFFYADEAQGDDVMFKVSMNGSLISTLQIGGSTTVNTHGNDWDYLELIIPSYTEVTITGENMDDTDLHQVGTTVTGRIYRE